MKYKNFTKAIKAFGFLSICAIAVTSCQKDLGLSDEYSAGDVLQDGSAKIRFVHVAPNLQSIDVKYNDGSVVNGALDYKSISGYTDVPLGSVDNGFVISTQSRIDSSYIDSVYNDVDSTWTLTPVDVYTPNQEGSIANLQQTNFLLKKDVKYTCFVYDSTSYITFDKSRNVRHTVLTEETPASSVVDTAWVRFYNLSSTIGPVDLKITNNGNSQITTISNNTFLKLPVNTVLAPGNYNFEVTQGGTITSRNNVDIQNAKGYTFYLRGIATATDSKQLELDVLTNGE